MSSRNFSCVRCSSHFSSAVLCPSHSETWPRGGRFRRAQGNCPACGSPVRARARGPVCPRPRGPPRSSLPSCWYSETDCSRAFDAERSVRRADASRQLSRPELTACGTRRKDAVRIMNAHCALSRILIKYVNVQILHCTVLYSSWLHVEIEGWNCVCVRWEHVATLGLAWIYHSEKKIINGYSTLSNQSCRLLIRLEIWFGLFEPKLLLLEALAQ